MIFKERWGAERSTLSYLRYPASSSRAGTANLIRKAKRYISMAPELSLKTVSNLIYRHMG
jgi:hypothetical protein